MRTLALAFLIGALSAQAESVTVRVLATTDLHGNIYPYDYYAAKPAARGLAKIATLVSQERTANPNVVLVDCGDTIQGSPLEGVHQGAVRSGDKSTDPMMAAMNRMGYDAMAVGNHEYNYGMKNLNAARSAARFSFVSANTEGWSGVKPYIVKTVAGVRIAIVGITTPSIPNWEQPENYQGIHFLDAVASAKKVVADLRARKAADVVLIIAHSGLDRDPVTGTIRSNETAGENVAYQLAADVPGVDAVIFGHTHNELPQYKVGTVLLMQPRNWGQSLGEMDITLEKESSGWTISNKVSRTIKVTDAVAADETIMAIGKPFHEAAETYLAKVVADSPVALSTEFARVEDNALVDAIQEVQLDATKADISFASAFDTRVRVPVGKLTVRQLAMLYPYDNTLYAIEGTGKMVRAALENSARYYLSCTGECKGPLVNREVIGYNYDMVQGLEYEIDLRRPAGQRVTKLLWKGKPLADDQPLKIALNSYRAGGSAGYTMFPGAKIVWRSSDEIREMMVRYYSAKGKLPVDSDHNWHLVPEDAVKELRREASGAPPLIQ
jgi:2',3'-cyclic-nucleotide 2'-phosphodiesterase/3'-nucleotidase